MTYEQLAARVTAAGETAGDGKEPDKPVTTNVTTQRGVFEGVEDSSD